MKRGSQLRFEQLERRDLLASLSITQLPAAARLTNDAHQVIEASPPPGKADIAASYSAQFTAADGTPGLFPPPVPRWESSFGSFQLMGQLRIDIVPDSVGEMNDPVTVQLSVKLQATGGTGARSFGGETELAYNVSYSGGETTANLFSGAATPEPYFEVSPTDQLIDELAKQEEIVVIETKVGESIVVDFELDGEAQSWQDESTGKPRGYLVVNVDVDADIMRPDIEVVPIESRDRFGFFGYINSEELANRPKMGLYWSEDTLYQADIDPPATSSKVGNSRVGSKDVTFVEQLEGWEDRFKYVLFVLDPDNAILESDESNNSTAFEVLAAPAITANTVSRQPQMSGGSHPQPYAVEFDIENRSLIADDFSVRLITDTGPSDELPPNFQHTGEMLVYRNVATAGLNRFGESQNIILDMRLDGVTDSWDWINPQPPPLNDLLASQPWGTSAGQLLELQKRPAEILNEFRTLWDLLSDVNLGAKGFETHPTHQLVYTLAVDSESGAESSRLTLPVTVEVDFTTQNAFHMFATQWASGRANLELAVLAGVGNPEGWILLGNAARDFNSAAEYYQAALDLLDPNFDEAFTPSVVELTAIPPGAAGLFKHAAEAKAMSSVMQEAMNVSIARANGARLESDYDWVARQLFAASGHASANAIHAATVGGLQSIIDRSLSDESDTSEDDLEQLLKQGFTPEAAAVLTEAGLNEADVSNLLQNLVDTGLISPGQVGPSAPLSVAASVQNSASSMVLLEDAIRTRIDHLGEPVQSVSFEVQERLRTSLNTIRKEVEANRWSVSLLARIESLIKDVRQELDDTNDVRGLKPYLDDAYRMLVAFQAIDITPVGVKESIETFVASGELAQEAASPLVEIVDNLDRALLGGAFDDAASIAESYVTLIRSEWGRAIPFHIASALDDQATYLSDLLQFGELQTPPSALEDLGHLDLSGEISIDVLANDTAVSDDLKIIAVSAPKFGTVQVNDNGTPDIASDDRVNYTANSDFRGTDSFEYVIEAEGHTSTAEVQIQEAITFGETFEIRPAEGRTLAIKVEESIPIYLDILNGDSLSSVVTLYAPSGSPVWFFSPGQPVRLYETGTYLVEFYPSQAADPSETDVFRLTNLDQQPILEVGQNVSGTLETESVFFRFNGSAEDRRVFDNLSLSAPSTATWQVFGPSLDVLEFGDHLLEEDFAFVFARDGTHFLQLENSGEPGLSFEFSMQVPRTSVDAIDFAESVNGSLALGENQIYFFRALQNDRIFFDAQVPGDLNEIAWHLRGLDGRPFEVRRGRPLGEQPADQDSTSAITLPATGFYQLHVSGTGDYAFRLLNLSQQPSLPVDTQTTLTLNSDRNLPGFETQLFRLGRIEADRLILHSQAVNGPADLEADWFLFSGNEKIVPVPLGQSFVPAVTGRGEPTLIVASQTAEVVEFTFNTLLEPPTEESDLTIGETVSGVLSVPLEQHTYTLDTLAGRLLYFDAQHVPSKAVIIEVVAPSGQRVMTATADDDEPFATTEDGRYDILVYVQSENQDGPVDYSFLVADLTADASTIALDTSVVGELPGPSGSEKFRFSAAQGDQLVLHAAEETSSAEILWTLYGSDGSRLTRRQLANSSFTATAPADGDYFLLLENRAESNQAFDFRISHAEDETTDIGFGEAVAAALNVFGERHSYTFDAEAGNLIALDSFESDEENLVVAIYTPSGQPLIEEFSTSMDMRPTVLPESGQYQVTVFGFAGATGGYSFELVDLANVPAIEIGKNVSGNLRLTEGMGSDLEYYRISLDPNQKIIISSTLEDAGGRWRIYDELGSEVGSAAFGQDAIVSSVSHAREYVVELEADPLDRTAEFPADRPFEFVVRSPIIDTAPIELDSEVRGNFESFGERDVYTLTGTQGQKLYFDWLRELRYHVQIISPSGDVVLDDLANRDLGQITLQETGTHSIVLDPEPDSYRGPTAYRFRIVDVDGLPKMDSSTRLAGTTNFVEAELFVLDVIADRVLAVEELLESPVSWEVYGPDDTLLASRFGSSRLKLDEAGAYLLRIAPSMGVKQDYDLNVTFEQDLPGDLNFDGHVGQSDINLLAAAIREMDDDAVFDLARDGNVDELDYKFLIEDILRTLPGDADLNIRIEFIDFLRLAMNYGKSGGWKEGDFDADGIVGDSDFSLLVDNFCALPHDTAE